MKQSKPANRKRPVTRKSESSTEKVLRKEIARLTTALRDIATDTTAADIETLQHDAREALRFSGDFECEAEELRSGIERLIRDDGDLVRNMVESDADEVVLRESDLQRLLDSVDARDSLAWLERHDSGRAHPKESERAT